MRPGFWNLHLPLLFALLASPSLASSPVSSNCPELVGSLAFGDEYCELFSPTKSVNANGKSCTLFRCRNRPTPKFLCAATLQV